MAGEPRTVVEGEWYTASQAAAWPEVTVDRFLILASDRGFWYQEIRGLRLYHVASVYAWGDSLR